LVFGSDWPLAPIKEYAEFIGALVPEKHHDDVFYGNAKKLFSKVDHMADTISVK